MRWLKHFAAGATGLAFLASLTAGAPAHMIYYPWRPGAVGMNPNKPLVHVGPQLPPFMAPKKVGSGKWADIKGVLPFANGPWGSMLLTDGTAIVLDYCTSPAQWYRLTPNAKGSYVAGKWSRIAAMPSGYSPLSFAQQVLPDGRVIINGGEDNDCKVTETAKGALYDPVQDSWTSVTAPTGWGQIGDASSMILPNGSYMLADCCGKAQAVASISGTSVTWTTTGSGKGDSNFEEGWTLLPDGNVLTVDTNRDVGGPNDVEIYDTAAGSWSTVGTTAQSLVSSTHEIGPAVLRPDGTVIQFGATGFNDLYDSSTGAWSAAPGFPEFNGVQFMSYDAPAAILPDGNVLVQASPPNETPSHFFEFAMDRKGNASLTQVNDTIEAPNTASFESSMLVLPTGQILWNNSQTTPNEVAVYTPRGESKTHWLPVVSSVSSSLKVGSTGNAISGTNFNGFSLGASYGDDGQSATNFPIVRIANNASGDVCYARSYNFSTMGVFTAGTTNAEFDIPETCETGASTLQVIVNGLASVGVSVTLAT